MTDVTTRQARLGALLLDARDVVAERASGGDAPSWCRTRGWAIWLRTLDGPRLQRAEREGLAAILDHGDAPLSLTHFVDELRSASEVAARPEPAQAGPMLRGASPRKRAQLAALVLAARELGEVRRVLDLGSGHGQLTRALADALGVPAIGLDRIAARVEQAARWHGNPAVRFEQRDLARELDAAEIEPDTLVVGLHACGALGERAVELALDARAPLLLVGCCAQKREGDRPSLVPGAHHLVIPHHALGLANVTLGEDGVEAPLEQRHHARLQRRALGLLFGCASGEAMRGVNRRRAHGDFAELARAVAARRGVELPSEPRRAAALEAAAIQHARARRFELPRQLVGRALERFIAFDRAAALAERGFVTHVEHAFSASISPRNLLIVARPSG